MTQGSGWDGILEPGETIVWQGRPERGIIWRDALSPTGASGVLYTGFAIFWMLAAALITGNGPGFPIMLIPLFGLPVLLVGLCMMGGHLVLDACTRSTTWHPLTDRTGFIARDTFGRRRLESYPIVEIEQLELTDGVPGDVIFGAGPRQLPRPDRARIRLSGSTAGALGVRHIAEARNMRRLMRDRRAALRQEHGEQTG